MSISRREIFRLVAGAGMASMLPIMARAQATGTGYKAIVNLFMYGGNDANNTIIPNDARFTDYQALRGAAIALPENSLQGLTGTGYGLHPSLSPLVNLWDEGALNWVLNTGPLLEPTTREQFLANPDLHPVNLFSHDAQQNLWQTAGTTLELPTGWMGRMGDVLIDDSVQNPSISLAGAQRAMIGTHNAPLMIEGQDLTLQGIYPNSTDDDDVWRYQAFLSMLNATQASTLGELSADIMRGNISAGAEVNTILNSDQSAVDAAFVDPSGDPVTGNLADQLKRVARLIEGRGTLNATRQSFMVATGGFDTHQGQPNLHVGLLNNVGRCVYAFYNTMKVLGVENEVALFSASDFNRVFMGNGSDGTDHAWGSHHFVVSGALKPNQLLGSFPELVMGGADDSTDNGRWIPSTSIEEYTGALVQWLGVSEADMPYVFPNWANWNGGGRGPVDLFA